MKSSGGFTLTEIIVAIIIISIIAIVGLTSHVSILHRIQDQYSSLNLACAQIEDLKTGKYGYDDPELSDIGDGIPKATTLTEDITGFTLTYDVEEMTDDWTEDGIAPEDVDPEYKIITVTCADDNDSQVQLNTYIVEKNP